MNINNHQMPVRNQHQRSELIAEAKVVIELFESAGCTEQIAYKLAKIALVALTDEHRITENILQNNKRIFFAFDGNCGFDTFKTAEEACAAAAERIPDYLVDGWDEEVTTVCWGEVIGQATMSNKRPAPKGSEFSYCCDYVLSDDHGEASASAHQQL